MIVTQDTPSHLIGIDASGRVSLPPRAETALASNGAKFDACDELPATSRDKRVVARFLKEVHYAPGIDDIAGDVKERMDALGTALEKLDKKTKNPKIVVYKQQSMEELVLALERALVMAKNPSAKADEVISYTREQFENIQNPHRALELELARLVEAKTPPNGEFYKTRSDRKELAVAFFHRVYGRFYEAGVLYKHQLRAMDFNFYSVLAMTDGSPRLPTKADFVSRGLQVLTTKDAKQIMSLMHAATTRKRRA